MPGFPFSGVNGSDQFLPLDFQTVAPWGGVTVEFDPTPFSAVRYNEVYKLEGRKFAIEVSGSWAFNGTLDIDGETFSGNGSSDFDLTYTVELGKAFFGPGLEVTYSAPPNYPIGLPAVRGPGLPMLYGYATGAQTQLGLGITYPSNPPVDTTFTDAAGNTDYPATMVASLFLTGEGAPIPLTLLRPSPGPIYAAMFNQGLCTFGLSCDNPFAGGGQGGEGPLIIEGLDLGGGAMLLATGQTAPIVPANTGSTTYTEVASGSIDLGFTLYWLFYNIAPATPCIYGNFSLSGGSVSVLS